MASPYAPQRGRPFFLLVVIGIIVSVIQVQASQFGLESLQTALGLSFSDNNQTVMAATTYILPPLPYGYDALEPHISKQIMELHHSKHHQTYVNNLNAALATLANPQIPVTTQINLQAAVKFNGGGHINHSLFWQNLASASSSAVKIDSAAPGIAKAINEQWGSYAKFQEAFEKTLLGIQGSGWGWLVKTSGGQGKESLRIVTTKDQDPVVDDATVPLMGIDMWEHAYYL
ncbi:MAG: hypothetical protein Q9162_000100 [Coniocarpon cinnabarinum]